MSQEALHFLAASSHLGTDPPEGQTHLVLSLEVDSYPPIQVVQVLAAESEEYLLLLQSAIQEIPSKTLLEQLALVIQALVAMFHKLSAVVHLQVPGMAVLASTFLAESHSQVPALFFNPRSALHSQVKGLGLPAVS